MQPPKSNEDDKEEVPSKSQIDIKDFDKVEIKAATVIDAENVPKSDKLLKIQVDLEQNNVRLFQVLRNSIVQKILLAKSGCCN